MPPRGVLEKGAEIVTKFSAEKSAPRCVKRWVCFCKTALLSGKDAVEKSIHSPVDMWKIALYRTADTKAFCVKSSTAALPEKQLQNCNSP